MVVGGGGEGITLNLHKITPDIKRGRVARFQEIARQDTQGQGQGQSPKSQAEFRDFGGSGSEFGY